MNEVASKFMIALIDLVYNGETTVDKTLRTAAQIVALTSSNVLARR